ncbi:MAG: isochorismatase family protein [Pseudomonadota bacterium]
MTERIWDRFLTERDKQVFQAAGYGARAGFGKRPAFVVVDVNYAFVGDRREPILESIKRWRNSCGEEAFDAVAEIARVIDAARAKPIPVIYTTGVGRPDGWDAGSWAWKNTRNSEDIHPPQPTNIDGNEIVPEIQPAAQDLVITKQKPSGFYGTPLAGYLAQLQCDSVIVCGTTTSGCVRATVIDAFSLNYRVSVMEEGCFDRSEASHAINLCDINAKYADVISTEEIIDYIRGLPDGLFDGLMPKADIPVAHAKVA